MNYCKWALKTLDILVDLFPCLLDLPPFYGQRSTVEIRRKLPGSSWVCFCRYWLEQRAVILICELEMTK